MSTSEIANELPVEILNKIEFWSKKSAIRVD